MWWPAPRYSPVVKPSFQVCPGLPTACPGPQRSWAASDARPRPPLRCAPSLRCPPGPRGQISQSGGLQWSPILTRSCVCLCRLSQTAALVFASLDCFQIFPYHKTQSLLGSKKSHSCLSGGDTTAGTYLRCHSTQYTFNKQSSEHSNCFVQLICNNCVICIESACLWAALS